MSSQNLECDFVFFPPAKIVIGVVTHMCIMSLFNIYMEIIACAMALTPPPPVENKHVGIDH